MERVHLIVGARAFHRNPYDGHTLNEQLEQAAILMQDCAAQAPDTVFVDLGYRGGCGQSAGLHCASGQAQTADGAGTKAAETQTSH